MIFQSVTGQDLDLTWSDQIKMGIFIPVMNVSGVQAIRPAPVLQPCQIRTANLGDRCSMWEAIIGPIMCEEGNLAAAYSPFPLNQLLSSNAECQLVIPSFLLGDVPE